MEKVAVLLPVYHKDKVEYIQLAVDSMLNQTYSDIRVFIGIDGPVGDEIKFLLNQYEKNDRIQLIWFPENRGLACVLNDLLQLCFEEGYDYIARMDADDISLNNRIEKQVSFLKKDKDVDVVGGSIKRVDSQGVFHREIKEYPLTNEECFKKFAKRNPLSHPAVMFRKSFFEKTGGLYRSEYRTNQDTVLWYDGFMHGIKMANISDVVLLFRVTDEMLGSRRGGWKRAKKQLKTRLMINSGLGYGLKANIYAYMVFVYMVSPLFIKKLTYKFFK